MPASTTVSILQLARPARSERQLSVRPIASAGMSVCADRSAGRGRRRPRIDRSIERAEDHARPRSATGCAPLPPDACVCICERASPPQPLGMYPSSSDFECLGAACTHAPLSSLLAVASPVRPLSPPSNLPPSPRNHHRPRQATWTVPSSDFACLVAAFSPPFLPTHNRQYLVMQRKQCSIID